MTAKKKRGVTSGQARAGKLFILPSMIVFSIFVFIPLIVDFALSTLNFDMMFNNLTFQSGRNYLKLMLDSRFWNSMLNTLYYTVGTVPIQIVLAFLTAVAIRRQTKVNAFFKSFFSCQQFVP
jgi:multiple sugar transport system permease protein